MKERQHQPEHDSPDREEAPAQGQTNPAGRGREEEASPTSNGTIQDDLRRAMKGWGVDKKAIFARLERATTEEKAAVRNDEALMKKLEKELKKSFPQAQALLLDESSEGAEQRGEQNSGRSRSGAVSGPEAAKAAARATADAGRAALDKTINTSKDTAAVQAAFAKYWSVSLGDEAEKSNYTVGLLKRVHGALKGLPEKDVRAGVWKKLILIDGGGGSWASGTGTFRLGADAEKSGKAKYGDHNVDWLSAVVRHEIGHAVDTALGGVKDFKKNVGGWWSGDIDAWAAKMGGGWSGKSGSPSGAERKQISDRIQSAMKSVRGSFSVPKPLTDGAPKDHPIHKYINAGVPVIEVAKGCLAKGGQFYASPDTIKEINGLCFSVNTYYNRFQVFKPEVRKTILRNYQLFSEDEFFAETYTVFYEDYDPQGNAQPGKHLKVAAWKSWMLQNVHNRGGSPDKAAEKGTTKATIGTHAGKHSDD